MKKCLLCGHQEYTVGSIVENSKGEQFEILDTDLTQFRNLFTNSTHIDWDHVLDGYPKKVYKLKIIKQSKNPGATFGWKMKVKYER